MEVKNKNILVTGGAGFIGTNLCNYLLNKKANVICIDNLYSSKKKNIAMLLNNKRFSFLNIDIRKKLKIKKKIDGIFHLACPASPPIYQINPIMTLETCFIGSRNILDLALINKCRILLASTSEIYGDPLNHPQKEIYFGNVNTLGPRACYDEGKRISETLFYEYFKKNNLNVKIARIFNTYGPYLSINDGRVISNFLHQALNNKEITIYGKGNQTRSFCYIDDLIDGLFKLFNHKDYIGAVNLGNPKEYTMNDLAKKILKITKSQSKIVYEKLPKDDPLKRKPDIKKAKTILKWAPKTTLDEGLLKIIEFYKTQIKI